MPTLKQMKKKLKDAAEMEKVSIIKGDNHQILIDLDGDGQAEAALIDTTGSDTPDLLALDLTGDHKFNLFLDDTTDDHFPDVVYVDSKGDGNLQLVGDGDCIKNDIHSELVKIYGTLVDEEADDERINKALHKLAEVVRKIRSQM